MVSYQIKMGYVKFIINKNLKNENLFLNIQKMSISTCNLKMVELIESKMKEIDYDDNYIPRFNLVNILPDCKLITEEDKLCLGGNGTQEFYMKKLYKYEQYYILHNIHCDYDSYGLYYIQVNDFLKNTIIVYEKDNFKFLSFLQESLTNSNKFYVDFFHNFFDENKNGFEKYQEYMIEKYQEYMN